MKQTTILILLVHYASSASTSSWSTKQGVFPDRTYDYQQRHQLPSFFTCHKRSRRGVTSRTPSYFCQHRGKGTCFISNTFANNNIPCNHIKPKITMFVPISSIHNLMPFFGETASNPKSFSTLASTRSKSTESSSTSSGGKKRNKKKGSSKPKGRQRMKKSEIDDLVRGMYIVLY